jgi:hypothetical protein
MRGTSTLNCVWNARLLRYHHQHHIQFHVHLNSSEVGGGQVRQPVDARAHYSPRREASLLPVIHDLLQILLFGDIQAITLGFLSIPVIYHIERVC